MPVQDNLDMTGLRLFHSKLEWKDHVRLGNLKNFPTIEHIEILDKNKHLFKCIVYL